MQIPACREGTRRAGGEVKAARAPLLSTPGITWSSKSCSNPKGLWPKMRSPWALLPQVQRPQLWRQEMEPQSGRA